MSFLKNAAALGAAAGLVYLGLRWARKNSDEPIVAEQAEQAEQSVIFPDETITSEQAAALYKADVEYDDLPNINPVDAAPVTHVIDPTKIACPEDFQDWEQLGCQG